MKNSKNNPPIDKMPIIRIAPVCNGKIYVIPHSSEHREHGCMDIPMVESVEHVSTKSDKTACKIKEKYRLHIQTDASPRFCVQHRSGNAIAYLYVLPLKQEDEIHFHGGAFISADDITNHPKQYTSDFQLESELLGMAAELWNDFYL